MSPHVMKMEEEEDMNESLMDKLRRHYYRKGSSPRTLRATNRCEKFDAK